MTATVSYKVVAPEPPTVAVSGLAIPEFNALTGSLSWEGEDQPGSRIAILVDDEQAGETTADPDGRWRLYVNLPAGEHQLAFSRLNEDGDAVATTEPIVVTLPGRLPQISPPDFSLPDELVPIVGPAAQGDTTGEGETGGLADSVREALDAIELPVINLPAGSVEWTGTAEPGSEVAFLVDSEPVATATADTDGKFTLAIDLTQGAYDLRLGIFNQDGELDGQSRPVQVEVTNGEDIELPADAVVTVQIQDVSVADGSADVLGEQVVETDGQQVPIPFEVAYDPAEIVENHL